MRSLYFILLLLCLVSCKQTSKSSTSNIDENFIQQLFDQEFLNSLNGSQKANLIQVLNESTINWFFTPMAFGKFPDDLKEMTSEDRITHKSLNEITSLPLQIDIPDNYVSKPELFGAPLVLYIEYQKATLMQGHMVTTVNRTGTTFPYTIEFFEMNKTEHLDKILNEDSSTTSLSDVNCPDGFEPNKNHLLSYCKMGEKTFKLNKLNPYKTCEEKFTPEENAWTITAICKTIDDTCFPSVAEGLNYINNHSKFSFAKLTLTKGSEKQECTITNLATTTNQQ